MADNMMRLAGRGNDGKAKALKSDVDGNLIMRNAVDAPYPPKIRASIKVATSNAPKWMDKDGWFWSSTTQHIIKFKGVGGVVTNVIANPRIGEGVGTLMVSDTGRIVCTFNNGEVYVSNEAQTVFALAFTFPFGYGNPAHGHDKYKNVLLISSYGLTTANANARFVWGSFDDGATWAKIFEGTTEDLFHVHAVCYDPWADRIWISTGDHQHGSVRYTDDRGLTWNIAVSNADVADYKWLDGAGVEQTGFKFQPTCIMAGPHSVMFGSDSAPDGITLWLRPKDSPQPKVTLDQFRFHYYRLPTDGVTTRNIFTRGWRNIEYPDPFWLFIAGSEAPGKNGHTLIIATNDGLNFWEIWKGRKETTLSWITGPHYKLPKVGDEATREFIAHYLQDGTTYHLTAEMPVFGKERTKPAVTIEGGMSSVRETVLNAVSVPANGGSITANMGLTGEELEVWLLIQTDKQPWSLQTSAGNTTAINSAALSPVYPKRNSHASVYTSPNAPSTHLFYGFRLDATGTGEAEPTNLASAKSLIMPYLKESNFSIINHHATDAATVTVRVLKKYK